MTNGPIFLSACGGALLGAKMASASIAAGAPGGAGGCGGGAVASMDEMSESVDESIETSCVWTGVVGVACTGVCVGAFGGTGGGTIGGTGIVTDGEGVNGAGGLGDGAKRSSSSSSPQITGPIELSVSMFESLSQSMSSCVLCRSFSSVCVKL